MATEVDICNLALSHIGDDATVASINPPEGSIQAEHCARFYSMARNTLQDAHNWSFCLTRVALARLSVTPASGWLYAYAVPSDCLSVIAIFSAGSADDFDPQQFDIEQLPDGTNVIYANIDAAVIRYKRVTVETSNFPPLFEDALTWLLASYLAGPVIKGEVGRAESVRCYKIYLDRLARAKESDSQQRRVIPTRKTPWIINR